MSIKPPCSVYFLALLALAVLLHRITLADTITGWGSYYNGTFGIEGYQPLVVPPSTVKGIAAGYNNLVGLTPGGSVFVLGDPNSALFQQGGNGGAPYVDVAVGREFALGLSESGQLTGWGWAAGTEIVPSDLTNAVDVAAGFFYALALKPDGTLKAWGKGFIDGPGAVPWGIDMVAAISRNGLLAVREDGTAVGWDYFGNLNTNLPANLTNLIAIEANLALRTDGSVLVWGNPGYGLTNVPPDVSNVVAIAVGTDHAGGTVHGLALRADGKVIAWGNNQQGQTNVSATLTNVTAIAAGNGFSAAQVGNGSPFFVRGLTRKIVADGTAVNLRVIAGGLAPLTYTWRSNGTVFAGATTDTLSLPDVTTNHAGFYAVTVSNSIGAVTSSNVLQVVPLLMTAHPQDQFPLLNSTASISVHASGRALKYQWLFNGAPLAGATSSALVLTNVQFSNDGSYSVIVSNVNAVTLQSSNAVLAVQQLAVWGSGRTHVPRGITNIVAVGADDLALRTDGHVLTWTNPSGQPSDLTWAGVVVAMAEGAQHKLFLRTDGTVVAGGDNTYGQSTAPAGLSNVVAITAGGNLSAAVRADGTVVGWGSGPTNLSDVRNVVAAAAGDAFIALLKSDGTVVVRGDNSYGQTNVPAGLTNVAAIAAGNIHLLALKSNGSVVAWGDNSNGQTNVPLGIGPVAAVAAGKYYSMALKRDGTVAAWGVSSSGQTNVPANLPNLTAISGKSAGGIAVIGNGRPVLAPALQITRTVADGANLWLNATASGAPILSYQWFFNGAALQNATNSMLVVTGSQVLSGVYSVTVSNNLGVTSQSNVVNVVPVLVTLQPARQITFLGDTVTFDTSADGRSPLSYQWQFNGTDLPGSTSKNLVLTNAAFADQGLYAAVITNAYGTATTVSAELALSRVAFWGLSSAMEAERRKGLTNVVQIASGIAHNLALKPDGTVFAWSVDAGFSQDYGQTNIPVGLSNVIAIAAGTYYNLALKANGTVTGWGYNVDGSATPPSGLSNVVAISAKSHSLALKSDGKVVAWGSGAATNVPVGLSNVVAVAAGRTHSLALKSDGTITGWGDNQFGQSVPPPGLKPANAIAAGDFLSVALQADGTVAAWGYQVDGRTNVPPGLSNVVAIAAEYDHCLAVKSDGTVTSWGKNYYGQTNVPGPLHNVVGIAGADQYSLALVGDHPVVRFPLQSFGKIGNAFSISVPTDNGRVYRLEYKDSLTQSNWTALPLVAGDGTSKTFTDPAAPPFERFYRIRRW